MSSGRAHNLGWCGCVSGLSDLVRHKFASACLILGDIAATELAPHGRFDHALAPLSTSLTSQLRAAQREKADTDKLYRHKVGIKLL
jgi:hypothetical protein